jgi:thiol-disulfide isomerase/thioredoxin
MIRKIHYLFLLLFLAALPASYVAAANPGYDIRVHIEGLRDTICYLGNHFGDKQYLKDTVKVDHDGWAEFKGKDTLTGGIYLIVMPNKTYFEILVSAPQKFTIETDTVDFTDHFKVTGSLDNQLFIDHQRYIANMQKLSMQLKARMDANKGNEDSTKVIRDLIIQQDKDVKNYRFQLMKDHPESFMSKIIATMSEPEIPEPPRDAKGNIIDSSFQYIYFKTHFWDKVDFSDERLLRTPILQSKIKQYTTQLTPPLPDSIIASCDTIIEKSKANKEVFKYCVATLTNFYENSNIMGYDAVFVHLAEKYYLTDLAFWADSTLKAKIAERVRKIRPNLLNTPAHDLNMPDTAFVMHNLYGVKAKYTVLTFWDPTCSHCKAEIPKLSEYYDSLRAKNFSIEVFSVGIESEIDLWKKFIVEHKLKWINVSDLYNNTRFRDFYDIYSTPVIYLLDDKKRIIAKRLDTEKLRDFIDHLEKKTP